MKKKPKINISELLKKHKAGKSISLIVQDW